MKKVTHVHICPKCGSTNITIPPASINFYMAQPAYCEDCRYNKTIPEIKISEVEEFKKNLKLK